MFDFSFVIVFILLTLYIFLYVLFYIFDHFVLVILLFDSLESFFKSRVFHYRIVVIVF